MCKIIFSGFSVTGRLALLAGLAIAVTTVPEPVSADHIKRYKYCFHPYAKKGLHHHPKLRVKATNAAYSVAGGAPKLHWTKKEYGKTKCFWSRYKTLDIDFQYWGRDYDADYGKGEVSHYNTCIAPSPYDQRKRKTFMLKIGTKKGFYGHTRTDCGYRLKK